MGASGTGAQSTRRAQRRTRNGGRRSLRGTSSETAKSTALSVPTDGSSFGSGSTKHPRRRLRRLPAPLQHVGAHLRREPAENGRLHLLRKRLPRQTRAECVLVEVVNDLGHTRQGNPN